MAKRKGTRPARGETVGPAAASALPHGRHGFSAVGRRKAIALAARTTAFADALSGRPRIDVTLPASTFLHTLRRRTIMPSASATGVLGNHYDLSRDLLQRHGARSSLRSTAGGWAMSRRHHLYSYMMLARRRHGGVDDGLFAGEDAPDPWELIDPFDAATGEAPSGVAEAAFASTPAYTAADLANGRGRHLLGAPGRMQPSHSVGTHPTISPPPRAGWRRGVSPYALALPEPGVARHLADTVDDARATDAATAMDRVTFPMAATRPAAALVVSPLVAAMVSGVPAVSDHPSSGDAEHPAEPTHDAVFRQLYHRVPWSPTALPSGSLSLAVTQEMPPENPPETPEEPTRGEVPSFMSASGATAVPVSMAPPMTALPGLLDLAARLQRKGRPGMANPDVQRRVFAVRQVAGSAGQPLDSGARRTMEATLGGDFSDVRVHTDSAAAGAASALSAEAFALGPNVYFAQGAYAPSSPAGLALLGHELTHTMQPAGATLPSAAAAALPSHELAHAMQRQAGDPQRPVAPASSGDVGFVEPPHLEAQALHAEAMLLRMFSSPSSPALAGRRGLGTAGQASGLGYGHHAPPAPAVAPLWRRADTSASSGATPSEGGEALPLPLAGASHAPALSHLLTPSEMGVALASSVTMPASSGSTANILPATAQRAGSGLPFDLSGLIGRAMAPAHPFVAGAAAASDVSVPISSLHMTLPLTARVGRVLPVPAEAQLASGPGAASEPAGAASAMLNRFPADSRTSLARNQGALRGAVLIGAAGILPTLRGRQTVRQDAGGPSGDDRLQSYPAETTLRGHGAMMTVPVGPETVSVGPERVTMDSPASSVSSTEAGGITRIARASNARAYTVGDTDTAPVSAGASTGSGADPFTPSIPAASSRTLGGASRALGNTIVNRLAASAIVNVNRFAATPGLLGSVLSVEETGLRAGEAPAHTATAGAATSVRRFTGAVIVARTAHDAGAAAGRIGPSPLPDNAAFGAASEWNPWTATRLPSAPDSSAPMTAMAAWMPATSMEAGGSLLRSIAAPSAGSTPHGLDQMQEPPITVARPRHDQAASMEAPALATDVFALAGGAAPVYLSGESGAPAAATPSGGDASPGGVGVVARRFSDAIAARIGGQAGAPTSAAAGAADPIWTATTSATSGRTGMQAEVLHRAISTSFAWHGAPASSSMVGHTGAPAVAPRVPTAPESGQALGARTPAYWPAADTGYAVPLVRSLTYMGQASNLTSLAGQASNLTSLAGQAGSLISVAGNDPLSLAVAVRGAVGMAGTTAQAEDAGRLGASTRGFGPSGLLSRQVSTIADAGIADAGIADAGIADAGIADAGAVEGSRGAGTDVVGGAGRTLAGHSSLGLLRDLQRSMALSTAPGGSPVSASTRPDRNDFTRHHTGDRFGAASDMSGRGDGMSVIESASLAALFVDRAGAATDDGVDEGLSGPRSVGAPAGRRDPVGALVSRAVYSVGGQSTHNAVTYGSPDTPPALVYRSVVPAESSVNGARPPNETQPSVGVQRWVPGIRPGTGNGANGAAPATTLASARMHAPDTAPADGGRAPGTTAADSGQEAIDMDRLVDQVINRVKRELTIEHERSGGFIADFMG